MPYWLIGLIMAVVVLFLVGGFTWQALDEEEFPDSTLPRWFVRLFRNR
jgi:hypothetical protein